MNILIDESLPRYVLKMLGTHTGTTVQAIGWSGTKNGALLTLAEQQFAVFVTADKNLQYQQNLLERRIAIIVFPSNRLPVVKTLAAALDAALAQVTPGAYIEL